MDEIDGETSSAWSASVVFRDGSRFWVQRVLVPLVVGVGVVGNLATIVVLTRRRMRSSTNVYLTALAVSDLLYLVFVFILSFKHYPHINEPPYIFYWYCRGVAMWLTDACSSTSVWLTVSFTVERYIAVCHPMRGRRLCTESRARRVILLVYLLCYLCTFSTSFEWKVDLRLGPDNSTVVYVNETHSALGQNEIYRTAFYWFSSIAFMFLPLLLLAIINCFLIHAVHRSRRQRSQMTQADSVQRQENRITVTLIGVVVLFLVCQSPSAIGLIYSLFSNAAPDSTEQNVLYGLGNIFNFLMAVNAAANFLLYCALSDKYRRTFARTFCRPCYKPPSLSTRSRYDSGDGPSSGRLTSVRSMRAHNGSSCKLAPERGVSQRHRYPGAAPDWGAVAVTTPASGGNLHVPLFESLKFQFLLHGLPLPARLNQRVDKLQDVAAT